MTAEQFEMLVCLIRSLAQLEAHQATHGSSSAAVAKEIIEEARYVLVREE